MNEPQPDYILQVGLGFWASKTLFSAVEMELFTELAKHPEDLKTLQGRLGLHPRSARDFLDALVSLQFLERRGGRYYNTPSTDFFLDKRKPSYNMLIETADGFDYTGADCSGWMKEVGFCETRVEHLIGPDSMVIGTK
jgi:hypothetical protein